jgi:hypothetical protein
MKTPKVVEMKMYVYPAAFCLCLTVAEFCGAADIMPSPLDCKMLRSSAATKLRIDIAAQGFSVLPPQGERWCYRLLTSYGVSFFKIPKLERLLGMPPSLEEFVATRLFSAMAMSLKGLHDLETPIHNPDELKTLVDLLIGGHLFSQIIVGVSSKEHRFSLLQSNVAIVSYSGATCVRFDGRVEERGNSQGPALVFVLNFPGNVVCRHPAASETGLIWVGFVERYLQGDHPAADMHEYEPFVQSLQFMLPR